MFLIVVCDCVEDGFFWMGLGVVGFGCRMGNWRRGFFVWVVYGL